MGAGVAAAKKEAGADARLASLNPAGRGGRITAEWTPAEAARENIRMGQPKRGLGRGRGGRSPMQYRLWDTRGINLMSPAFSTRARPARGPVPL